MRAVCWMVVLGWMGAAEVRADGPAVAVGNIRPEMKKKAGAEKGKNWVKLTVVATVNQKLDKFEGLKVRLSCKDGDTVVSDEAASSSARLYELEAGKTRDVEFRMFFDKGKALPGGPCTVTFGHGKTTKKEEFTTISEHCLQGGALKDGACP